MSKSKNILIFALENTPLILLLIIFMAFMMVSPDFFKYQSLENAVKQASYIGIIAVGMAFVLLTGGIDLSVGSNMYLSTVIAGLCIEQFGLPAWIGFIICLCVGFLFGLVNALVITRLQIVPFVTTLATMVAGRGLAYCFSHSKSINFPDVITDIGSSRFLETIPYPILIFALVLVSAWIVLHRTQPGRQIYAIGSNLEAARKAGINTPRIRTMAYVCCGIFAALGGFISVAQLGNVNANFGKGDEFDAIAAAVLGGISLFGGVGSVFPGVIIGSVLIQLVSTGLVSSRVDIYLHSMISAVIIFVAILIDSQRTILLRWIQGKNIINV